MDGCTSLGVAIKLIDLWDLRIEDLLSRLSQASIRLYNLAIFVKCELFDGVANCDQKGHF
jgi:hypothetical protein